MFGVLVLLAENNYRENALATRSELLLLKHMRHRSLARNRATDPEMVVIGQCKLCELERQVFIGLF